MRSFTCRCGNRIATPAKNSVRCLECGETHRFNRVPDRVNTSVILWTGLAVFLACTAQDMRAGGGSREVQPFALLVMAWPVAWCYLTARAGLGSIRAWAAGIALAIAAFGAIVWVGTMFEERGDLMMGLPCLADFSWLAGLFLGLWVRSSRVEVLPPRPSGRPSGRSPGPG